MVCLLKFIKVLIRKAKVTMNTTVGAASSREIK